MPDHPGQAVTLAGEADLDRFARQRLISGWNQERLRAATVVIAGAGALGNEAAKNLALAGAGRLVLCDPDVVSVSNLSRTVLFSGDDIGQPKALAAARFLRGRVPGVDVEARVADLVSGVGLGELADASLVIGCVDTIRARMQLLGRCALVNVPLLDGGTSPWGGEIRVRADPQEACFACTLTPHQRSVSDLPWSCAELTDGERPEAAGIATTALVAGWLATAAFGLIFGKPPAYRILTIDAVAGRATPTSIERDPDCPFHRPLEVPLTVSPASHLATVAEFLAPLDPADEPATWASFPMAERPLRGARTTRLRDADPASTLASLGVAPQEILPVIGEGGDLRCHRLSQSATPATSR